ncbi:MAG: hypothetical protein K6F33_09190, partial [Bacteroidales bacterium]|nr:hypothetical protein [Bacteroidales bacterium]
SAKTTIYRNGEQLYSHDGSIAFVYAIDGHVYYGIRPSNEDYSCTVYADGKPTNMTFGPNMQVWKGDKDIFFDDCTGEVTDQTGKTVLSYTRDEDGAQVVNEVIQQGNDIYVLINRGYGSEPSEIYKNGKQLENKAGFSGAFGLSCYQGNVYVRALGNWQGKERVPIIYKNMEPVLGDIKPEGYFWLNPQNGDIYTSEFAESNGYLNVYQNGKNPKTVRGFPETSFNMVSHGNDVYYWSFAGALDAYIYKNMEETPSIHYPAKKRSIAHCTSMMNDGHLYAAIIDFNVPNTVSVYKDSQLLKAYPAHVPDEDGTDMVSADFFIDID